MREKYAIRYVVSVVAFPLSRVNAATDFHVRSLSRVEVDTRSLARSLAHNTKFNCAKVPFYATIFSRFNA